MQTLLTGVLVIYVVIGAVIWFSAPRISVVDQLSLTARGKTCELPLSMNLFVWPYAIHYYYFGAFAKCVNER